MFFYHFILLDLWMSCWISFSLYISFWFILYHMRSCCLMLCAGKMICFIFYWAVFVAEACCSYLDCVPISVANWSYHVLNLSSSIVFHCVWTYQDIPLGPLAYIFKMLFWCFAIISSYLICGWVVGFRFLFTSHSESICIIWGCIVLSSLQILKFEGSLARKLRFHLFN